VRPTTSHGWISLNMQSFHVIIHYVPCHHPLLSGTALRVPKKPGESCLKPEKKNKSKTHFLLKHTHRARPTLRWPPRPTGVAQSKAPSNRFRLARGLTPPSSGFRLARGLTPPSSRFRLARGLISASLEAPPQARLLPHAGTGI
jgi:hypothetical protein